MKMDETRQASMATRGAVKALAPATLEAHRTMIEQIIKESSLERLIDILSDYVQARAGMHNQRPTISQRRYRELGPAIGQTLTIAIKRGL